MPRKARIDATGALHHIIVRGIEHRKIFYDDEDREAFVDRFGKDSEAEGSKDIGMSISIYEYPSHILSLV